MIGDGNFIIMTAKSFQVFVIVNTTTIYTTQQASWNGYNKYSEHGKSLERSFSGEDNIADRNL